MIFLQTVHILVDMVGKKVYDRFRLSTKLSIITDESGTPLGISLAGGNIHDIKLVEDTFNFIPFDLDYFKTEYLVGDQ